MTTYSLPIVNFAKQQTIFDNTAKHRIVAKGRRFGLTKGASNDFIKTALQKKFKRGLWVDTVNTNIDRYIERYFGPVFSKLPDRLWSWRKQDKIVVIRDSFIDFRSADRPENIEGFGYDKYFINEAGIVLKNSYLYHNAIRPMLWDYDATGVIGGTPKGKGLFNELYLRGLDEEQPRFASFKFSTFDNPFLNHQEILEEMKSMPERVARQEIYADFLEDTGVVFTGVGDVAILAPKEPIREHLYIIGCDIAKAEDFTVITVYDRKDNKQVFQMRFNKIEWPFQKQKIMEVSKKFNNALVYLDASGIGDPIADDLLRAQVPVEPVKFTNEQKKMMIEKLANWIELKYCYLLNLEETKNEFNSFTYEISSTGRIQYEAPVGFHDDIVMSHALAIWGLQPIYIKQEEEKKTIIAKDYEEKAKGSDEFDIMDIIEE